MQVMFLLIDKPKGITSHDVVGMLRKITGERRIGHAGTLDPNATGLLIVGVGRESTRELWIKFGKLDKTYEAEITLGEERETDDVTGISKIKNQMSKSFTKKRIEEVLKGFIGEQMQMPPDYSAIKIKGKKAYEIARKGGTPSLSSRVVTIYSIKLNKFESPVIDVSVKVSSGTYVRALARDIGRKLGCGAYLSNLRRTKIGEYDVDKGVTLGNLKSSNIEDHYIDL